MRSWPLATSSMPRAAPRRSRLRREEPVENAPPVRSWAEPGHVCNQIITVQVQTIHPARNSSRRYGSPWRTIERGKILRGFRAVENAPGSLLGSTSSELGSITCSGSKGSGTHPARMRVQISSNTWARSRKSGSRMPRAPPARCPREQRRKYRRDREPVERRKLASRRAAPVEGRSAHVSCSRYELNK